MTSPIVFGSLFSTFARTVVLALEEKGVAYELRATIPHSKALVGLHPFGKVPAFEHGDVRLCETLAIVSYVNEAFEGPALTPTAPLERAEMLKWISLLSDSVYAAVVKGWLIHYAFPRGPEGKPDIAAIEAGLPKARRALEVVDRALEGRKYLAGDALSLADLYLAPIVSSVPMFPGGPELLEGLERLKRLEAELEARPSFVKTKR
ncbi:MAG: glutathione S-transferase family protein [Polyangiaceae bacterium]|nr:glutathione S-transferase family protein [Polyangiaceae bacterium]